LGKTKVILLLIWILGLAAWTAQGSQEPTGPERMAQGIATWKLETAHGRWWACGVRQADVADITWQWVQAIWGAAGQDLNPWALAGLVANESKFDECALGKRTRDWGYRNNVLRPRRQTISHTRAEVVRVVQERKRVQRGAKSDLGPGQLRYGVVYFGDPEAALTIDPGMSLVAKDMRKRRKQLGKFDRRSRLRPWGTWPGRYEQGYDRRVTWLAHQLGARQGEI
jgi:hypothetical protein